MSSGKQTNDKGKSDAGMLFSQRQFRIIGAVVLLAGWILILNKNQWGLAPLFLSPGAFFMGVAWLAVVMTAHFLWRSGMTAASEGDTDDEDYWRPIGRRHELDVEKRTLLKAIKEIEFDHDLGKTSAEDSKLLTRVYRQRAIEVIKAIDALDDNTSETASVRDRIDRDVKARLELAQASKKNKKKRKGKTNASEASS